MSYHDKKGSIENRTTIRIRFIMAGRLSVGHYSHYQTPVEPGFPAGTFISSTTIVKPCLAWDIQSRGNHSSGDWQSPGEYRVIKPVESGFP